MKRDVILINSDDASRACAKAIHEFFQNFEDREDNSGFYAMKMMELTIFSAMVVSKLFEEEEGE